MITALSKVNAVCSLVHQSVGRSKEVRDKAADGKNYYKSLLKNSHTVRYSNTSKRHSLKSNFITNFRVLRLSR